MRPCRGVIHHALGLNMRDTIGADMIGADMIGADMIGASRAQ